MNPVQLILTTLLVVSANSWAADCSVRFNVVDEFGKALPYRVDSFRLDSDHSQHSRAFRSLAAHKLPCGTYSYEFSRLDLPAREGWIAGSVNLAEHTSRITLRGIATPHSRF